MTVSEDLYDVIVIGAGMGGLTAASLFANDGYSVLVLEAVHDSSTGWEGDYTSKTVVSNIPIWSMADITHGKIANHFQNESKKYTQARGFFKMGIVTDDLYPENMGHHHQAHIYDSELPAGLKSGSIFVSFSVRDDTLRAPAGEGVLNVSAHTLPEFWFNQNGNYDLMKKQIQKKNCKIVGRETFGFFKSRCKIGIFCYPGYMESMDISVMWTGGRHSPKHDAVTL